MSVDATRWVWEHSRATGIPKYVLVALADWGWESWPSQSTLAAKTGLSRSAVSRAIQTLVELGELETRPGRRGSLTYHMTCSGERQLVEGSTCSGERQDLSLRATPPVAESDTTCRLERHNPIIDPLEIHQSSARPVRDEHAVVAEGLATAAGWRMDFLKGEGVEIRSPEKYRDAIVKRYREEHPKLAADVARHQADAWWVAREVEPEIAPPMVFPASSLIYCEKHQDYLNDSFGGCGEYHPDHPKRKWDGIHRPEPTRRPILHLVGSEGIWVDPDSGEPIPSFSSPLWEDSATTGA